MGRRGGPPRMASPHLAHLSIPDMKAVHGMSSSAPLGQLSIAVSSIAMHLDKFLGRGNIEQDMADFASQHEYSLIVLMGINTNAKGI